ncbi:MAG: SCO family protein [Bdellovibrionaceae bacterium]|nr:SCO family protein [Pseudobdellovibrionaceae bacterium]
MKIAVPFCILAFTCLSAFADGEGLAQGNAGMPAYDAKPQAQAANVLPEELQGVTITEKIGAQLDLNLPVTQEDGTVVPLSTFFHEHKPVILSPVYFNCPGLCNFHLNGLVDALKMVDWSPALKFEIIALSFDPREKSDVASKKKDSYMKLYARPGTEAGWHFVTADAETIKKITETVGFQYKWNEKAGEWSHASAAIMISPKGQVARYLHGIMFEPRDLKLALNEAADGRLGGFVDSAMLFCFKYDRHQSKYGLQVFQIMKAAGALTALALALWLGMAMIKAKRENT